MVRPCAPAHIGRMVPVWASAAGVGPLRPRAVPTARVRGAAGAGETGVDGPRAVDGAAGEVLGMEGGDREHVLRMSGVLYQHKSSC